MLDEMELRVNPNNNATGSMKNQLLRAGIRMPSRAQDKDDRTVCTECAPSVTFTCFGCKTERAADQIKESCGDPAEHLCKTCYSTVPASKWDELMEKLEDAHRHDYT